MIYSSPLHPMTTEHLSMFPTLTNEARGRKTTEAYKVIGTMPIINAMADQGFRVFSVQEANKRNIEDRTTAQHIVRFRANDWQSNAVDGTYPEIVLRNSHDGSRGWCVYFGLFRLVCTNGLVAGSLFDSYRVSHVGDVASKVTNAVVSMQANVGKLMDKVEAFRAREMTVDDIAKFAVQAFILRYPKGHPDHAAWVVLPRRRDDTMSNLWTVFNRAQENMINGSMYGRIGMRHRRVQVRGLTSLDRSFDINRKLFDLAESFLPTL